MQGVFFYSRTIERKAFDNGVEVNQVVPAYMLMIAKLKYVRDKGLSIHRAGIASIKACQLTAYLCLFGISIC